MSSAYCMNDSCSSKAATDSAYCPNCVGAKTPFVRPLQQSKPESRFRAALRALMNRGEGKRCRVGLVFDRRMCGHEETGHPERPERITSIYDRLKERGLAQRCIEVNAREATEIEILSVHDKAWLKKTKNFHKMSKQDLNREAYRFNSVYMNEHTMHCALLSAGSTAEIVKQVCEGRLDSGVAVVRPPGHHAEAHCAMGFCVFNNVAIAAQMAVHYWKAKKVAIIDWDVHHGNGTQNMFIEDKFILYLSVHRFDNGGFYPGSRDAGPQSVGKGKGEGFNVNIGWNDRLMGDEHYKLCFQHVVVPILSDYKPDLILISAGFDAARGDPLGGCDITPAGYAVLTSMLAPFGKIVMVLEGGYNLDSISESFAACTEVLLGDVRPVMAAPEDEVKSRQEKQRMGSCVKSILETIRYHAPFWPSLVPFAVLLKEYAALVESNADLKKQILSNQAEVESVTESINKMSLSANSKDSKTDPAKPASTATASASIEEKKDHTTEETAPQEGFAAPAKHFCPHAAEFVTLPLPSSLPSSCSECDSKSENWVCLSCHVIGCGRHAKGHMAAHVEATGHSIALGFDDLSFWCYRCDSYLHHLLMERIFESYAQMCELKFGERPPPELFQGQKSSAEEKR